MSWLLPSLNRQVRRRELAPVPKECVPVMVVWESAAANFSTPLDRANKYRVVSHWYIARPCTAVEPLTWEDQWSLDPLRFFSAGCRW